jgi:hypothetical protein
MMTTLFFWHGKRWRLWEVENFDYKHASAFGEHYENKIRRR